MMHEGSGMWPCEMWPWEIAQTPGRSRFSAPGTYFAVRSRSRSRSRSRGRGRSGSRGTEEGRAPSRAAVRVRWAMVLDRSW